MRAYDINDKLVHTLEYYWFDNKCNGEQHHRDQHNDHGHDCDHHKHEDFR